MGIFLDIFKRRTSLKELLALRSFYEKATKEACERERQAALREVEAQRIKTCYEMFADREFAATQQARHERDVARLEAGELRFLIGVLLKQAGGSITVSDITLDSMNGHFGLNFYMDEEGRQIVEMVESTKEAER